MGVVEEGRLGGLDLCLWGKYCKRHGAIYPVLFHMLDVAALAGELWDRLLVASQRAAIAEGLGVSEAQARCLVMFFAGLHDVGKVSRFQACEPVPWARVGDALRADTHGWRLMRHERASMHALLGLLAEMGYELSGDGSPAVRVAQIAGGHHGRYPQVDVYGAASPQRVRRDLGGRLWQELRRQYADQLRHLTGAQAVPCRVSVTASVLVTGLVMVADRLASQQRVWLPRALMPAYGAAEHFSWARWMARQAVEQSQLSRVQLPRLPFTAAHPHLPGPNALQASVMRQLPPLARTKGPGILLVTDGTGAGKTATALQAAQILNDACSTQGICYLLPTTATADAAYDTLRAYVSAHRPTAAVLTLVHNHSWQNAAYTDQALAPGDAATCTGDDPHEDEDAWDEDSAVLPDEEDGGGGRRWVPDGWLRGWDRALLAQFTVATVDQALMAALPVRYNALRMLALSGRCVIVDEAHALTTFSQRILQRLLHWLGALGTPVVVLSATLPGHVAAELVYSYLAGAGHKRSELRSRPFTVPYPGWLFADASTAHAAVIDESPRAAHTAAQRRTLQVRIRPVRYRRLGDHPRRVTTGERLARITAEISPVAQLGGCAVVGCATVADAQDTYLHLRHTLNWPDGPKDVVLLHARFPGRQLEQALSRVRAQLGPNGPRPDRLVVVTTSLLEMSLNIDADILVSDLTSLARLIQRAGRLWRFEQAWQQERPPGVPERPAWIQARGARLTVLHPVDADRRTILPGAWAWADTPYLQHATAHLLTRPDLHRITLPEQAQHLVELIHQSGQPASWSPELATLYDQQQAADRAEEHASTIHLIPPHDRVASLADLHRQQLTAAEAATRPHDRPRRVLACYRHPGGPVTLDPAGRHPLPQGPSLRPADVRAVLQHTLPVPATWVAARTRHHQGPDAWQQHPLLADLVLLPHDTACPQPVRFSRHQLHVDDELGLIHDELQPVPR
ncbi:CRISPR-associated endonuclease Cas3'' [Streptomyces sp. NPDC048415]|uniref:CRISPR-associated endonuclease Cas3'' n=1 Tax=Streptomyces sp. NPDC048415 TaxID=3154822 RepID=UPI0034297F03